MIQFNPAFNFDSAGPWILATAIMLVFSLDFFVRRASGKQSSAVRVSAAESLQAASGTGAAHTPYTTDEEE